MESALIFAGANQISAARTVRPVRGTGKKNQQKYVFLFIGVHTNKCICFHGESSSHFIVCYRHNQTVLGQQRWMFTFLPDAKSASCVSVCSRLSTRSRQEDL